MDGFAGLFLHIVRAVGGWFVLEMEWDGMVVFTNAARTDNY